MATEQKFTDETLFVETTIDDTVKDSKNPPTTKALVEYLASLSGNSSANSEAINTD